MKRTLLMAASLALLLLQPIYASANHFYTTDKTGEKAVEAGYRLEGIAGYVYATLQPGTIAIYRWFSTGSGNHLMTADTNGENAAAVGYQDEGLRFYCSKNQQPEAVAFNRWHHLGTGMHFYTTDAGGEAAPALGYLHEGVMCYVYLNDGPDLVPLYRWVKTENIAKKHPPECWFRCREDDQGRQICSRECRP